MGKSTPRERLANFFRKQKLLIVFQKDEAVQENVSYLKKSQRLLPKPLEMTTKEKLFPFEVGQFFPILNNL